MKLIMEGWRKYSTITENQDKFGALVEKLSSLDEASFGKTAALAAAMAAFGGQASAGGITDIAGMLDADETTVQQAGDLAKSKSSTMGQDSQAFQDADALSDWVVAQPSDVPDSQLVSMAMDHFGWGKSKTYDAYTVLDKAIDYVQSSKSKPAKPKADAGSSDLDIKRAVRAGNKAASDKLDKKLGITK